MSGKIFIGTSGWHYKHWRGLFYPTDLPTSEWLKFYAQHFKTVELNNSFYRLPTTASFETWREVSPSGFVFAVKGSRFTTHMKKLKDPKPSTDKFFDAAVHLRSKLGPILFQLPPHWRVDKHRLEEFLEAMPKSHQYTFEFRDDSWLNEGIYEVLERHNAALCIHDLGGRQSPIELTANFTYIRFHGPTEFRYAGSYSQDVLEGWAERFKKWKLKSTYAYFNNDIGGHAPRNASTLIKLLG